MKLNDRQLLSAILRNDLASFTRKAFQTIRPGEIFVPNWHIEAIAWHLKQCRERKIKRLIITVPPRHMKSILASVAFPAWILGLDPTCKLICASYSDALAGKHAFDTRTVMDSPWYRNLFPATRAHPRKNTATEYVTTRQGFRLATSVGGTLTGRGGDILILDDPHKPDEVLSDTRRQAVIDWYRAILLTRLDNKRDGVIILIQQRLHEEDLAGYLLEQGGCVHLNIPAIAEETESLPIGPGKVHIRQPGDCLDPDREPREVLDQIQNEIGSYAFAAQYQQRPAPIDGGIIKWNWFQCYAHPPRQEEGDRLVISWDTAQKAGLGNDYSVGTVWLCRENKYYLLQVVRERLEYPALQRRIVAVAEHWQADTVLIEDKAGGIDLIQDLRRHSSLNIVGIDPRQDKATRALDVTPIIEGGRVFLPKEAPWLADFRNEVVKFPHARHDDQVDSLSQFLGWVKTRAVASITEDDFIIGPELESVKFFREWGAKAPSPWK